MDGHHEQDLEDLDLFQKHIADRFAELLSPSSSSDDHRPQDSLLSISWLSQLLDVFLCCEAEFKAVLIMGRDPSQISKPPLDRLIPELLDRVVKALDICNAVCVGIESVRHYQRVAEIAVFALEHKPLGDGNVRRAKRALTSLVSGITTEDKDTGGNKSTERTWSFGRRGGSGAPIKGGPTGHFRSLSWSVAKNWSAAKQIQAMSTNLVAPRGGESSFLASLVYVMSTVVVFVMWILVAAIPCQERNGLATHLPVPKQLSWAPSLIGLQEKIGEEWKKKEKKGSAGLLEEMQRIEKLSQCLVELVDSFQFPLEAEKEEEMATKVAELSATCRKMDEGLMPLQVQIREVFHRIVRSRTEILEALEQAGKVSAPAM